MNPTQKAEEMDSQRTVLKERLLNVNDAIILYKSTVEMKSLHKLESRFYININENDREIKVEVRTDGQIYFCGDINDSIRLEPKGQGKRRITEALNKCIEAIKKTIIEIADQKSKLPREEPQAEQSTLKKSIRSLKQGT